MVAPTAHITQQKFLVRSFPKIDFFIVVKTMLSISWSLYDLSL